MLAWVVTCQASDNASCEVVAVSGVDLESAKSLALRHGGSALINRWARVNPTRWEARTVNGETTWAVTRRPLLKGGGDR